LEEQEASIKVHKPQAGKKEGGKRITTERDGRIKKKIGSWTGRDCLSTIIEDYKPKKKVPGNDSICHRKNWGKGRLWRGKRETVKT